MKAWIERIEDQVRHWAQRPSAKHRFSTVATETGTLKTTAKMITSRESRRKIEQPYLWKLLRKTVHEQVAAENVWCTLEIIFASTTRKKTSTFSSYRRHRSVRVVHQREIKRENGVKEEWQRPQWQRNSQIRSFQLIFIVAKCIIGMYIAVILQAVRIPPTLGKPYGYMTPQSQAHSEVTWRHAGTLWSRFAYGLHRRERKRALKPHSL